MSYQHLTYEECAARYPRLIAALKWVACLSSTEAGACIRDYRDGAAAVEGRVDWLGNLGFEARHSWGSDMLRYGGGEAVAHYGGPAVAIAKAIRLRRNVRSSRGGYLS